MTTPIETLNQQEQALHDFITITYPKRGLLFSTSWSTGSLWETEEEKLVNAFLEDSDLVSVDWFSELPGQLFQLAVKAGATKEDWQMDYYAKFAGDFMNDAFQCHLRVCAE